ncbi:FlaD/FlaE family flagellar protein [Candidatus Altiarchaeota archaeon]
MAGLLDKIKGLTKKKEEDNSAVPKDSPLPFEGGSPVEGGGGAPLPPGVAPPPEGGIPAPDSTALAGGGAPLPPDVGIKLNDMEAKLTEVDKLKEQIGEMSDNTKNLEVQLADTSKVSKASQEKLTEIDKNMKKFLSLYEMVTNQINPFVESKTFEVTPQGSLLDSMEEVAPPEVAPEEEYVVEEAPAEEVVEEEAPAEEVAEETVEEAPKAVINADEPLSAGEGEDVLVMEAVHRKDNSLALKLFASMVDAEEAKEKKAAILKSLVDLGWITPKAHLDISKHIGEGETEEFEVYGEDDQGEASLPMPPISPEEKESLIPLMKWIDEMSDKVGAEGIIDILKYLVELGWVTPEAHEELMRYIKGDESIITGPEGPSGPFLVPLDSFEETPETTIFGLSWMRFLLGKAGEEGCKRILASYLDYGWITAEASEQLFGIIDSLDEIDKIEGSKEYEPTTNDHATSLLFVSRIKGLEDADRVYQSIKGVLAKQGFTLEDKVTGFEPDEGEVEPPIDVNEELDIGLELPDLEMEEK